MGDDFQGANTSLAELYAVAGSIEKSTTLCLFRINDNNHVTDGMLPGGMFYLNPYAERTFYNRNQILFHSIVFGNETCFF